MFHANGKKKICNRITYITQNRLKMKDKGQRDQVRNKGQNIMIKRTIQQENINLVNTYTPNSGAPKHVKQILMETKGERLTGIES